jgi:hypothetical protein
MIFDWSAGSLADGLACYHSERFWHAHEHWEAVWLKCNEPEKTFMQALIQVTAAFHHFQRNEFPGAISLLRKALARLETYPEEFGGIAVTPLRESIREWLRALQARDRSMGMRFPEIV